mgnify:CR=1 FL=1
MAVITCPVCGFRVNACAGRCPECGADPSLSADATRADLLARGLELPAPYRRRVWSRRRRLVTTAVAFLAVALLSAPLWLGYFGPEAAVYATTWLPWRSHLSVELDAFGPGCTDGCVQGEVRYSDPWPGGACDPGTQHRFVTVERAHPLLPWIVTESGTGP